MERAVDNLDSQLFTQTRLTLLETVLKKLIVTRCCGMSPQISGEFKRILRDTSSKYDYSKGSGPTPVDKKEGLALEAWGRLFFADIESREQEFRERGGLPLASPIEGEGS